MIEILTAALITQLEPKTPTLPQPGPVDLAHLGLLLVGIVVLLAAAYLGPEPSRS